MSTESAIKRIKRGLEEAAAIAACEHKSLLAFHPRWRCADCGGQFSQDPRRTRDLEGAE